MSMLGEDSNVEIFSVQFADTAVQITYAEPRDKGDAGEMMRIFSFDVSNSSVIHSAMEELRALLDEGLANHLASQNKFRHSKGQVV